MLSPFSLILGGGSARWLAHIGVIRRLEELQTAPDLIVGTSMGAIVGALYACGYTSHDMERIAQDLKLMKLVDLDVNQWIIRGKKIMETLHQYFWDTYLSETNIPLKIIATNLDTGEKKVFEEGKIIDAIRASISIPGIFAPYHYDGVDYIDGGITANLPVEEALIGKRIIAVSVQIPITEPQEIKKKWGLFSIDPPFANIYTTLRKTVNIMITKNESWSLQSRTDVHLLKLGIPHIQYHEFDESQIIIQAGYDMASTIDAYLKKKTWFFDIFRSIV